MITLTLTTLTLAAFTAAAAWAHPPKRTAAWQRAVDRQLLRIARCETGYLPGGQPNWRHHNAVYGGALGFAHSTWAQFRLRVRPLPPALARDATPAQQLAVARELVAFYGGYSSWPSCSRRLGLR